MVALSILSFSQNGKKSDLPWSRLQEFAFVHEREDKSDLPWPHFQKITFFHERDGAKRPSAAAILARFHKCRKSKNIFV
jgi:hypothetical protein